FSMGRFLNLFMLLTFAYAMVNYYDSSIPGLGFSIKGFIDGGQISAPTTEPAFADLASLPGESCGTDGFRRLLHGSDRDLPGSVCFRGAVACSTPRAALPGDGTPDSGVGHAANSGSISVAAGAEISTAGSRCDLWQRLRPLTEDMGSEEVVTSPRAPCPNSYVERLVRSIRRECLDHVIVWNQPALRRILRSYFA